MAAFNDIEDLFRRTLRADAHTEFSALTNRYAERKWLTRDQRDALTAYASLRNAIAHGRYFNGRPIADPVPEVVEGIERLRDLLERPPKALSAVSGQQVKTVHPDDDLQSALSLIGGFDFSQLPVYGEEYVGLLTTNAIARWLAAQLDENGGLAETTLIRQVLQFVEEQDRGYLAPRTLGASEAIDLLEHGANNASPVAAVIITDTGKAHERPLAVVVRDDLPALYAAVDTRV
jgi:CBS domain-containing protein